MKTRKCLMAWMSKMGLLVLLLVMAGCATTSGSSNIADRSANLPKGAEVKVLRSMGDEVVIGVKGVEILSIKIYGRDIENADITMEDGWTTFVLPKGRWFNFVFMNPIDKLYHFAYVTKEDADMPPAWMDKSITTYQPPGWGAAMTAREFKM